MSKGAVKARPVPAGLAKPHTSVGLISPAYGCNTEVGKIAQGIVETLAKSNVQAGVVGRPEPTGCVDAPQSPDEYGVTVSLASPWAWRLDAARPLFGTVHEAVESPPATWHDALRFAQRVFAPSPWAVEALGGKTELLRFGVDAVYAPSSHGQQRDKFRVLFAAEDASEPRKGLWLAVAGFKKAFEGRNDVELVVRSTVRAQIDKDDSRIRFAFGNMAPPEQAKLYRSADVLIYSSQLEAFGFEALEAMACGTPAIHSGESGMADFSGLGIVGRSRRIRGQGATWFEMTPNEIASLLQFVETERDTVAAKAAKDATSVDKRFRWSVEPLIRYL